MPCHATHLRLLLYIAQRHITMSYRSLQEVYIWLKLKYGMTNLRVLLSDNIKKRREKLGISQAQLAEKADTSTNYISQIEQQIKFPSVEMLERIAKALEFDSVELFYAGPYSAEAIQHFQEGLKADFEERLENLFKSIKLD